MGKPGRGALRRALQVKTVDQVTKARCRGNERTKSMVSQEKTVALVEEPR